MMSLNPPDQGHIPRFSKSETSNTYLSFTDLCSKFDNPLKEPCCDHWKFCEKKELDADNLLCSVDLVCSNTTLTNPEQEVNDRNLSTFLKAFALIYVLPEVDWTAETIDLLLAEGTDLFQDSSETENHQGGNKISQSEAYSDEKRIKRKFHLEGHTFTLALEPRFRGDVTRPLEPYSKHTIKNLRRLLQKFFTSSRYCLLLTRVGNLLIWRRGKVFFVMNVKGKQRDNNMELTILKCLKTIDDVVKQARNLSGIGPRDEFILRELVVVHLETPDGCVYIRDSSYRPIELKVANKSYAYLKASLHLSLNTNESMTNRGSLMVAVGSILASKVYHPSNWNTNMLDRLMCYGLELSRSCWSDCLRDQRPVDLDTFPTQLRLGQFVLELKLIPNVKTGHWKCGDIIGTHFETHFREAFKNYSNVVFQINNQMYAMWAKGDFYYLLDPFRHSVMGTHTEKDKFEGARWATLRMFRDQLTLLSVFHEVLKESNRQSTYYLHAVRVRNVAECPEGFALAPLPGEVDTLDVESLNEAILFSDHPGVNVSEKFMNEISDYEEEEKLKTLLERQSAENTEGKKNVTATTKTRKSKTKVVKNAKRCRNAKKSTTSAQEPKKTETVSLTIRKNSVIVVQEQKEMHKQTSTRRIKRKSRKSPRIPPNSEASNMFSRQKGGSVSGGSPANPPSTSPDSILNVTKLENASLKASELRIVTKEGSVIRKYGHTKQSEATSPQKVVRDVRKPSKRLGVALSNEDIIDPPKRNESGIQFPGFNRVPQLMAVAGSESGSTESLKRMLGSAFKVANRVLAMTPGGNYVIFRHSPNCTKESAASWFYLFDGCTCDIDRFRHLDLSKGTAGLIAFRKLPDVICYITDLSDKRTLNMLRNRMQNEEPIQEHEA